MRGKNVRQTLRNVSRYVSPFPVVQYIILSWPHSVSFAHNMTIIAQHAKLDEIDLQARPLSKPSTSSARVSSTSVPIPVGGPEVAKPRSEISYTTSSIFLTSYWSGVRHVSFASVYSTMSRVICTLKYPL